MTDIDVTQDPQARTLTVTTRFDAPPERVWQVWADPRQLERWWGPPAYPATVLEHDLRPGGTVTYFMTGPEGDTPHGWWRILAVEEGRSLELEDGFADADGRPDPTMPTSRMRMTLEPDGSGTRMVVVTTFASTEAMAQLVGMGMVEGIREAVGQIPAILASSAV